MCKSFVSKTFYIECPSLHSLPKFVWKTKSILVGIDQYVGVLFFISIGINLHEHRFEVYTMISDIHNDLDIVMGIRNVYEIVVVITTRNSCLHFQKRSNPFFANTEMHLKPREYKIKKKYVPLMDEISGLLILKQCGLKTSCSNIIKVKLIRDIVFLIILHNYLFLVRVRH